MRYLIDTNVFINRINNIIIDVAAFCKRDNCGMYISPNILRELKAPIGSEYSNECYTLVNNCIDGPLSNEKFVQMVEITSNARKEYKQIRARYYHWITDPNYLKKMIDDGILTEEEVKNIRYKDVGECELLAIAKTSEKQHKIVTDDQGKVFKHPNENIYDYYKDDEKIKIIKPMNWLSEINYNMGNN